MTFTRAMEEQLKRLLKKLGEMKSVLTVSINANKEDLKDNFNTKLATNEEEFKNDFKEILNEWFKEVEGRIDENFGEDEGIIEALKSKFENIKSKVEGMENKLIQHE